MSGRCPECGRAVDSSVCMGPHPGFSLSRAVVTREVVPEGVRDNLLEVMQRVEHQRTERMRLRLMLAVTGRRAS